MPAEAERIEEPQQPQEPEKLTIDLDQEPEEGGEEKAQPDLDRAGRRAHYRELKKAHEQTTAERDALKREVESLRQSRQEPQRQEARQQPGDPPELAPIRARLSELEAIEDALMERAASQQLTPDQQKDLQRRYRAVKREELALIARGVGIQQRAAAPQSDPNEAAVGAMLRGQFPEVYANKGLLDLAQGEYSYMLSSGAEASVETMQKALTSVRNRFGLGRKPPAATDAERARFASIPARAGATGGSQGWQPSEGEIRTAREWAKAKGMDVTDAEACRLWANKVGRPAKLVR